MRKLLKFFKEEEGATALEYGLMAAAITGVIIGIVITLGGTLNTIFTGVNTDLQTVP